MKQMSKAEILLNLYEAKKLQKKADKAPFTGLSILCNYVLWKKEHMSRSKLTEYNQIVQEYDVGIENGSVTRDFLEQRLWDKAEFDVKSYQMSEEEIQKQTSKNGFKQKILRMNIENMNIVNKLSTQHLLIHFNALIDMGYGKVRLNRVKDEIKAYLDDVGNTDVMALRKELFDKVGIYIEMPA